MDEDDFDPAEWTAPIWAKRLGMKLNRIHVDLLRSAYADRQRDYTIGEVIMATQVELVEKIRQQTTFSKSTNMTLREVLKLLREGQSDPAKNDEAIALLETAQADDMAILKENTSNDPSAN